MEKQSDERENDFKKKIDNFVWYVIVFSNMDLHILTQSLCFSLGEKDIKIILQSILLINFKKKYFV